MSSRLPEVDQDKLRPTDGTSFVFSLLEGEWELDREIQNTGLLKGVSTFTSIDFETLHYVEEGQLELISGFKGSVFREYYYQLAKDHILVSFADSPPGVRPFIRLRPQHRAHEYWAKDLHYCGTDHYECTYRFASRDAFSMLIKVDGSSKNYVMKSRFTRAAS